MYKLKLNQKNIPQIILQMTPLRSVASFFLQIVLGRGEGAMGVQLNVESTTNIIFFYILQQKFSSTSTPIILQCTTDFSENLQHFVLYIIPFYLHEKIDICSFDMGSSPFLCCLV